MTTWEERKYKNVPVKTDTYNMLKDGMEGYEDTFDARIKRLIKDSAELRDLKGELRDLNRSRVE